MAELELTHHYLGKLAVDPNTYPGPLFQDRSGGPSFYDRINDTWSDWTASWPWGTDEEGYFWYNVTDKHWKGWSGSAIHVIG